MPKLLTEGEAKQGLASVPRWRWIGGKTPRIQGRYTFENFVQALQFVNKVGRAAEAQGHHPDITVRYNRVTLDVFTHCMGGVTTADLRLARKVSALLPSSTRRKRG